MVGRRWAGGGQAVRQPASAAPVRQIRMGQTDLPCFAASCPAGLRLPSVTFWHTIQGIRTLTQPPSRPHDSPLAASCAPSTLQAPTRSRASVPALCRACSTRGCTMKCCRWAAASQLCDRLHIWAWCCCVERWCTCVHSASSMRTSTVCGVVLRVCAAWCFGGAAACECWCTCSAICRAQ